MGPERGQSRARCGPECGQVCGQSEARVGPEYGGRVGPGQDDNKHNTNEQREIVHDCRTCISRTLMFNSLLMVLKSEAQSVQAAK